MALRETLPARLFYKVVERHLLPRIAPFVRSPTHLTVAGAAIAVMVPFGFHLHPLAGSLLLTLSGLADAVDGILARSRHMETAWGAFLDSTLDRLSDQFYLAGFWVLFWPRANLIAASTAIFSAALLSLLISYTKARAAALGVHCRAGLMDRGLRTLALIGWALLLCLFPARRETILWSGLLIFNILVLMTFLQRLIEIRANLQRVSSPGPLPDR